MLAIALTLLSTPAFAYAAGGDTSSTFWWRFPLSDCGYDDIGTPKQLLPCSLLQSHADA